MAKHLSFKTVREMLRQVDNDSIEENAFAVLKSLCRLAGDENSAGSLLELVLRARA